MAQHFYYPAQSTSISGSITVDQGTPNNDANAWPVRITDGTHDATVTAGGALNVAIASGLSNPLPVSGPLTDVELRASAVPVSAAALPLPAGAATEASLSAFSAKSAGALVPERFDEQVITYVAASTRIDTVTYKLAAATVATLTMSYDGSDRLIGVVKT